MGSGALVLVWSHPLVIAQTMGIMLLNSTVLGFEIAKPRTLVSDIITKMPLSRFNDLFSCKTDPRSILIALPWLPSFLGQKTSFGPPKSRFLEITKTETPSFFVQVPDKIPKLCSIFSKTITNHCSKSTLKAIEHKNEYKNKLNKKEGCNTRTSQEVTHPSTTLAQARFTAEFWWDPVH